MSWKLHATGFKYSWENSDNRQVFKWIKSYVSNIGIISVLWTDQTDQSPQQKC